MHGKTSEKAGERSRAGESAIKRRRERPREAERGRDRQNERQSERQKERQRERDRKTESERGAGTGGGSRHHQGDLGRVSAVNQAIVCPACGCGRTQQRYMGKPDETYMQRIARTPPCKPRRRCSRKRAVAFFGWVFFLISLGPPHVGHMGRTCGEPDRIELTATGVKLNGSRRCTQHPTVAPTATEPQTPGTHAPTNGVKSTWSLRARARARVCVGVCVCARAFSCAFVCAFCMCGTAPSKGIPRLSTQACSPPVGSRLKCCLKRTCSAATRQRSRHLCQGTPFHHAI